MKWEDLSPELKRKIRGIRWDGIIEKHEGPFDYGRDFARWRNFDFMKIKGYNVLLPVDREHHSNITILRVVVSADHNTLTIFLKDTTYIDHPSQEYLDAGYVAVCDQGHSVFKIRLEQKVKNESLRFSVPPAGGFCPRQDDNPPEGGTLNIEN